MKTFGGKEGDAYFCRRYRCDCFADDKDTAFSVNADSWYNSGVCTETTGVGANVISKDGNCTTDSLGYFSVSDSCKTLSFSHVNYESRLVNLNEVRDTVFMISKLLNIKEVVVFGHGERKELPDALKKQLEMEKENAKLAAIDPSSGNLLSLFAYLIPKKWRKNSKEARRKRLRQILENY